MNRAHRLLFLCLVLLLAGCIQVKDFGPFWDSGTLDPAIEGTWTSMQRGGSKLVLSADGRSYRMRYVNDSTETDVQLVRTLTIGENRFLMVKKQEEDRGGHMIAYAMADNQLAFFGPNRDKQGAFVRQFPDHPFAVSRTALTIQTLDKKSYDFLQTMASDPQWWQEIKRYYRE